MNIKPRLFAGAAAFSFSSASIAHHSNTMYDQQVLFSIQGTVIEYEWRNPHVYFWIEEETDGGESTVWEVEGPSPGFFRRLGWTREMLSVGEAVKVTGNPARSVAKPRMLMETVEKADDTVIEMSRRLIISLSDREFIEPVGRAETIEGVWMPEANIPLIQSFAGLPLNFELTDAGRQAVESYDEKTDSPAIDCVLSTAPRNMIWHDIKSIEVSENAVRIGGEIYGMKRIVHLDVDDHSGASPSHEGHSIGHWEGDTLVVDTALFLPHRAGNSHALPSSPLKHVVERFALNGDKTRLTYSFVLEDPEYLAAPVTGEVQWVYREDKAFAGLPCDPENAERFTR